MVVWVLSVARCEMGEILCWRSRCIVMTIMIDIVRQCGALLADNKSLCQEDLQQLVVCMARSQVDRR